MAKIKLYNSKWSKIIKFLNLIRLPNTKTNKLKHTQKNYSLMLNPPCYYPRVHFITRPIIRGGLLIEFHVDISTHQSDYFHPKIDKIKNIIDNI